MQIKTVLALSVLAGAITFASAEAAVTAKFDIGNVAMGYSDGYYDNAHHWHHWRNHGDMDQFRQAHADTYHEWRHDDRSHHDEGQH